MIDMQLKNAKELINANVDFKSLTDNLFEKYFKNLKKQSNDPLVVFGTTTVFMKLKSLNFINKEY